MDTNICSTCTYQQLWLWLKLLLNHSRRTQYHPPSQLVVCMCYWTLYLPLPKKCYVNKRSTKCPSFYFQYTQFFLYATKILVKASNCLILANFWAFSCLFHRNPMLTFFKLEHFYGWLKYEWNGFVEYPSIYVLCCLISKFEAFRLLNLEVFETLLLIKMLLIQKTGCT